MTIRFRKTITRFCQMPLLLVPAVVLGLVSLSVTRPGDFKGTVLFTRLVLATMFVCYLIGSFIKFLYFKDRPEPRQYANRRQKIDASSFPSVHTAQATVVLAHALIISNIIIASTIDYAAWIAAAVTLGAFVFYALIARSRLVLKKHFLIDIVFGTVLGVISVIFTMLHYQAVIGMAELIFGR